MQILTIHYLKKKDIAKINKILEDKKSFIKELQSKTNSEFNSSKTKIEKEIKKLESRINELQAIEKRLYEDMVLGKITDEMFYNLSKEYQKILGKLNF